LDRPRNPAAYLHSSEPCESKELVVDVCPTAEYGLFMGTTGKVILEQFRKLTMPEQRELLQILLREAQGSSAAPRHRKTLDEVLGKFIPAPEPEVKDHNYYFAEAILASKQGGEKL
jgi:hypothetical protein